jgi:hypothetical protein
MKKITQKLTKSTWRSSLLAITFLFSLTINSQDLSMQGIGDYNVGNVDGASGSDGKFIHLVANADIADLGIYSMKLYSNANTASNSTFSFEAGTTASAGDHILVARSISALTAYMDYAVFDQSIESSFPNWNGDDSVELLMAEDLVETYGEVGTDGSGEEWEYEDSWAYKVDGIWTYGGVNCTDGSTTSETSDCPYPYMYEAASCSYSITVTDSYGDGWNGAYLEIFVNDVSLGLIANLDNDGSPGTESQTYSVEISEGDVITSNWISGDWDSETSYSISNSFGGEVVFVQGGDAFAEFTATCMEMYNVTFSVNTAETQIGEGGIFLGGGIIGGANAVAMADDDADGIWVVTIPMLAGSEGNYAFFDSPENGGDWGSKENLAGQSCADAENFDDRILQPITADTTLLHCFGICGTDGTCTSATYDVTFSVNTANIVEGVGENGMFVGGGVLGGANAYAMSDDDGDGTWTVTVALLEGLTGNYTFVNSTSNYDGKENIAGQECADGIYDDRLLAPVTEDTILLHCYGTCDTDGTCTNDTTAVTFNVDMSQYGLAEGDTVHVNGEFTGWCGSCGNEMSDDDGDGIYTITFDLEPGSYFWKYTVNGWDAQEGFNEAIEGCTAQNGENFDRQVVVGAEAMELSYCWNSCEAAGSCTPVEPVLMPIDHENENVSYFWNDFGGAFTTVIANTDASGVNTSPTVAQSIKTAGSETWAGTFIVLDEPLDFSTLTNLAVDVWTPDGGELVNLKVEKDGESYAIEINQPTTVASGWETLTYDLSDQDLSLVYDKIVMFFDFEVAGDDTAYYFDNIRLVEAGSTAGIDPGCNDFESGTEGWTVVDAAGNTSDWLLREDLANESTYSMGHGYLPGNVAYNDWLVSPAYNTTGLSAPTLSYFEYTDYGTDSTEHNVLYSTDYDGDATTATWTVIYTGFGADAEDAWAQRSVSIPSAENVVIAFQYIATYGANWNIDDVCIQEDTLSTIDTTVLDMRIYPNPVDGNFVTIQTPVNGVKYVEVFDITGKRLMNTSLSSDTLDVSSFSAGVYLVKLTVEGQSKTSKLIIR